MKNLVLIFLCSCGLKETITTDVISSTSALITSLEQDNSFIDITTENSSSCSLNRSSCKCNIWNDDCPIGQKCNAYSDENFWDKRKCVPIFEEPDQLNEKCSVEKTPFSGVDSCDVGLICWNINKHLFGKCVSLCQGDSKNPTCPINTKCYMFNDSFNICLEELKNLENKK